jgi:uncharacterized protein YjbJ (UPF0337 family)
MATLKVKGERNIVRGKLKQKRARRTDRSLQYVEGKSEELPGRIQKHTSEIREDVRKPAVAATGKKSRRTVSVLF